MFEGINLITHDESKELFDKQNSIMNMYLETEDVYCILQLALLQTLSPISDYATARAILTCSKNFDDFNLLVIGAYLSTKDYDNNDCCFLPRLLECDSVFSRDQKAITRYLYALQSYNKNRSSLKEVIHVLDESIELYSNYASNYYLRYLITGNEDDLIVAKNNVSLIISDKDVSMLSKDDLIKPNAFIDEHIYMTRMVSSTYHSLFGSCDK